VLLDDLSEAVVDGTRKEFMETLTTVRCSSIDDFGMRKLPLTAAEDLLEIVMRRYERAQHAADLQPPGRGLGQAAGRRGLRSPPCWTAFSITATCSSAVHELAHQGGGGGCGRCAVRVGGRGGAGANQVKLGTLSPNPWKFIALGQNGLASGRWTPPTFPRLGRRSVAPALPLSPPR